jgi:hypothetical protein
VWTNRLGIVPFVCRRGGKKRRKKKKKKKESASVGYGVVEY